VLTIDTHHDFGVPADRVWAFLEDFANIEAWWPADGPVAIREVVLEGEGIGLIRHIHNHGMPHPVSERLDFMDSANRALKLSIVGHKPAGIVRYQAHGQLIELDAENCRLTYHSEFEAEPGREEEAKAFLTACYPLMFNGLEQAAQRG